MLNCIYTPKFFYRFNLPNACICAGKSGMYCRCVSCVSSEGVSLFVGVCVFACLVSLVAGRHGAVTTSGLMTLAHRWGKHKMGGEKLQARKGEVVVRTGGRGPLGAVTEVRYQGATGQGWCAASGRVCRFWFHKVTKKYVEHLESGTSRHWGAGEGLLERAGGDVLQVINIPGKRIKRSVNEFKTFMWDLDRY